MENEEIEQVARRICEGLGLDPEATVAGGVYDDDTPAERATRVGNAVPMVLVYRPLWRMYRSDAAKAIAMKAAVAGS